MTILEERIINKAKISGEKVIILRDVGKKYILHHERPTFVENVSKALLFQKKEEYWALRHINLEIGQGEKIGFYGSNGSGKTTLLKMIVGISSPTEGKIITKGKIISLIDLEAGFHLDLTGQENIFLNGLVIGMTKEEIKSQFAKIVKFADLGHFITAPIYTYSSGMKLRLGFSIAIHANPDILLLDEVMNKGDEDFRRKSEAWIERISRTKATILMVNQEMNYLNKNCSRVIMVTK